MKVWTIAAQKGGVGKTTTAVSLAGALLARGARVLLIDLDPHGSLTGYFGLEPDDLALSVYDVFEATARGETPTLAPVLQGTPIAGLTLAPSSPALVTLERRYGQRRGLGLVLQRALHGVRGHYDYCVIDCPPTLGVVVVNALAVAERLIIPVQTDPMSAQALDRMLGTLRMIGRSRGASLPYLAVPTMFDRRTRAALDTLRALRARSDLLLWNDVIPIDTLFREASRAGQLLPLSQPQARGSQAYLRLADHLLAEREPLRAVG